MASIRPMVDSVAVSVYAVVAHGGEIVQPIGADAPEITARFRDPEGNVIGLYPSDARTGQICPWLSEPGSKREAPEFLERKVG